MGRAPCCDKANVKKGPWSPEEDAKLKEYIEKNGTGGNWIALPHKVGLRRCGKSCRLRWLNYLRPNIKHGDFSDEEDRIICSLYATIGSRWSIIAGQLAGRTDNDIKNYWNTKLKKKLMGMQAPSATHYPLPSNCSPLAFESATVYQGPYFPVHANYYTDHLIVNNDSNLRCCSSSDGSCCITNQITDPSLCYLQGYNFTNINGADPPDYYSSIEEIKELISSSNNSNLSFFVDDVKTEEKMLEY